MNHYFETPTSPGPTRTISATIWGREYHFTTSPGVFSGSRLDPGTAILLREAYPSAQANRLLDLGCGYGPIAVSLARELSNAQVDAIDINERALELTRHNAQAVGVANRVHPLLPHQVDPHSRYDEIWSNPPIRIGKSALHDLLLTWLPRLEPNGRAVMVVSKNLGADSLQAWLTENDWPTRRVASAKGFRVLITTPLFPFT